MSRAGAKISPKVRLDQLLVDRRMADSREKAQALIRAGLVVAGEGRIDKPGTRVAADIPLRLKGGGCLYVSRGGTKLAGALEKFGLTDLTGKTALDVGVSTGGFTDCLLQHGAARVWGVDTGRGQMHDKLRRDPRVRLRENANARELVPEWFEGEQADLIAIDVSFISLRLILPPLAGVLAEGGIVVALIKPQFEAGPADVGRGGIVRDPAVHRRVLHEILAAARSGGWRALDLCVSPLPGAEGNIEFFLRLERSNSDREEATISQLAIERAMDDAYTLMENRPPGEKAGDGEPSAPPSEEERPEALSERTETMNPPEAPATAVKTRAHIVVYGNPHKPGIGPILRALSDWSAEGSHRISVEADIAEMAFEHESVDEDAFKVFQGDHPERTLHYSEEHPTLLLTLGGDGTMLHAIHRFWPLEVPVFGVSLGTLSFNAAVMPSEVVAALEQWLRGELDVSDRMVLRVTGMRGAEVFAESFAVNDVVLGKQENLRMIRISLRQGQETISSFAGDGLIISTPTGSTAYNLSAGGPIVFPTMRVLVATAICPHTLAARAVVLNPTPPLVMEYVPRYAGGLATLAIDGQTQWTLQSGDKVLVEASEHSLKMIGNNNPRYFERLRQKLSWSSDTLPDEANH